MSDFGAAVKLTHAECLTYNSATTIDVSQVRSLLFAPGSDEHKLVKALESDADAVVADLEDAVAPGEKQGARELVREVFARPADASGPLRLVRFAKPEPHRIVGLAWRRSSPRKRDFIALGKLITAIHAKNRRA